ncbi:MAG: hypothetical protein ACOY0S_04705 [Patescibacteria group bacterium]
MDHKFMLLAQNPTELGKIGGEGLGPFAKADFTPTGSLQAITRAISSVIGIMTIAAAIWFIFQFTIGGFSWITAGGDKGKLEEAQRRLNNAFIGLVVVVAGWAILALAGQFFGYDIIISDPGRLIEQLRFQ